MAVKRSKFGGKSEPVSPALIASLVHPDRSANVYTVRFSDDGKRLFAAGYPSGVVQVWDVEKRRELRQVETWRGYRGSATYAHLSPGWERLYVPVESRKVKTVEKDGKKVYRFEYSGEVRVWDLANGKSLAPVKPAAGHAPAHARLSPDGKSLVVIERPSFDADAPKKDRTVLVTLADGRRRALAEGFGGPVFTPDGKQVVIEVADYEAKVSTLRLFDVASGKELAKHEWSDKARYLIPAGFSPDGAALAVDLGGKKGADREVWFLDGKTLERKARYSAKGDPDWHGWGGGGFTPDGRRYFVLRHGAVDLIEAATGQLVRSVKADWPRPPWQWALSADGRYLAAGWMPKVDPEREHDREPDPRDLPQPRVTLIDLSGKAPPRVLIAPHGYVGGVAFRPDGKALAFGGAGAVHLFGLEGK